MSKESLFSDPPVRNVKAEDSYMAMSPDARQGIQLMGFSVNPPHAIPAGEDKGATKADVGKPRWSLLMGGAGLALLEIIKVLEFGAKKYSPGGWKKVVGGYGRYKDALYRHLHSIEENGPLARDPETGLLEWAHVGCNVVFMLWYVVTGRTEQ
jgi:hypothetical protein